MGDRCKGCCIERCVARGNAPGKATSYTWAKVHFKLLANRTMRHFAHEDGNGDIFWLTTVLVLDARRIGPSHGVLCDHGIPISIVDIIDASALSRESVERNLARLVDMKTVVIVNGVYTLPAFDELQYDRSTRYRAEEAAAKHVAMPRAMQHSKQPPEAEAEADPDQLHPLTPASGGTDFILDPLDDDPGDATPFETDDTPRPPVEASTPPSPPKPTEARETLAASKPKQTPRQVAEQQAEEEARAKNAAVLARCNVSRADLLGLYTYWAQKSGHKVLAKLPTSRYCKRSFTDMVVDLLDLGYSLEDLRESVDGNMVRPWNVQQKQHAWDLVFRDQKHVDLYRGALADRKARDEREREEEALGLDSL